MNNLHSKDTLPLILGKTLSDSGKTQQYMAKKMHTSVTTVHNWLSGYTYPNLDQFMTWCEVLNLNPLRCVLDYMYPDTYSHLNINSSDKDIRNALIDYLLHSASTSEIRMLAFCIFGNTGSSWNGLLNLMTMHSYVSPEFKLSEAMSVVHDYEICKITNNLSCDNHILPDEMVVKSAINAMKNAVVNGSKGYTNKLSEE